MLGLPYPGGPSIQRTAETGDPRAIAFPRAMAANDSLEFSYSGLKTAVLYKLRENGHKTEDVAASFQFAAVEILIRKTRAALKRTGLPALVVAGGVAANKHLRERLAKDVSVPVFVPPFSLCVDNGAMIAAAGHSLFVHGKVGDLTSTARITWPIA